jgi:hypothetical protein
LVVERPQRIVVFSTIKKRPTVVLRDFALDIATEQRPGDWVSAGKTLGIIGCDKPVTRERDFLPCIYI